MCPRGPWIPRVASTRRPERALAGVSGFGHNGNIVAEFVVATLSPDDRQGQDLFRADCNHGKNDTPLHGFFSPLVPSVW